MVLSNKHFYLKISYLSLLFSAKSTSLSPTLLLRDRTKSAVFLSSYSSSSILSDQLSNVNCKKCLWYGIIPPIADNYVVLSNKHFYLKISYLSLLFSAKSTSLSPTLLLRDRTKSAVFLSSYSSSSILSDQLSNVNYKKCLWYGIIPPISIENLFIGFTL